MSWRARASAALWSVALLSPLADAQTSEPVVTSLTVFAGTREKLWRTKDWGATWQPAESGASGKSLVDLSDVRAILTLAPRVWAGGTGGLFVSDDFGLTWSKSIETPTALFVLPSRYPGSDPTVFLGTAEGLLKSDDAGKTFKPTPIRGTPVFRGEWPGPALVMATGKGVFVSSDAAATFNGPGQGLPEGEVFALALSSFFGADPVMFAGTRQGVFRSGDAGQTWAPAGLSGQSVRDLVWFGPILYAAAAAGLFRSDDAGQTWAPFGEKMGGTPNRLLFPLYPDSGAVLFVGTDDGVYRSDDGGVHWAAHGMKGQPVLALATFPPPEKVLIRREKK